MGKQTNILGKPKSAMIYYVNRSDPHQAASYSTSPLKRQALRIGSKLATL